MHARLLAIAVASGTTFAVAFLTSDDSSANLKKEIGARTMPAVAFVLAADRNDGQMVPVASGSGTILTADGSVLTNHHVVYDEKANRYHDVVAIGLLKAYDQAPELTCLAVPQHGMLSPELDLAIVKCETDLSGKAFTAAKWPTVPVGTSNDLQPGSTEIFIMGYPGVGGPTIHVTKGTVSGFLGKDGGAGRYWIKTDAAIAHGNSGGTAIDESGGLVGIPTAVYPGAQPSEGERVGLLRPVELARPLIDRALAGWTPGTVSETPTPPQGQRDPHERAPSRGPAHEECELSSGVTLTGRVVASDNNEPVEGAYVIVLKPGLRRGAVGADYKNIDSLYASYGISNEAGDFTAVCPIARDKTFTVLVVAKGFVELSGDNVLDTARAPDRFAPWGGKIRLQRQ
jgi:S1-C subfamily serine protease